MLVFHRQQSIIDLCPIEMVFRPSFNLDSLGLDLIRHVVVAPLSKPLIHPDLESIPSCHSSVQRPSMMVHQRPLIQTPSPPPYTNKIDRGFSFEVEGPCSPALTTNHRTEAFRLVRLALPDLDPGHYGRCSQVSTRSVVLPLKTRIGMPSLACVWSGVQIC